MIRSSGVASDDHVRFRDDVNYYIMSLRERSLNYFCFSLYIFRLNNCTQICTCKKKENIDAHLWNYTTGYEWLTELKSPSGLWNTSLHAHQLLSFQRLYIHYFLPLYALNYYNNTVIHIRNRYLDSGDVKKKTDIEVSNAPLSPLFPRM